MAMSRKDYVRFAAIIAGEIEQARHDIAWEPEAHSDYGDRNHRNCKIRGQAGLTVTRNLARSFADIFALDNSHFDRARFYEACGIGRDGFS